MASILIVEDNADNMKLFQWILEDAGRQIVGAASAEDGLALLERQTFDLVVMDISLPGMDGKEATRRLRADPRFARLPVVAASAHASKNETAAIEASGVSAVIAKPIDEEAFLQLVNSFLDGPDHD